MFSLLDRQIARHWRDRKLGRNKADGAKTGRRVAVVGNCQSFGYAFALKLFDPALTVDRYPLVAPSLTDLKTLRAPLTIGADGRNSAIRKIADIETITLTNQPDDIIWMRMPMDDALDPKDR